MNKTVTINISGIIFHIEEDAYEKLSKYLSAIRSYFKDSDGCDEIMADIESRIAELLKEKTGPSKEVVLMDDVNSVMETMGRPEEFAGDEQKKEETKAEEPVSDGKRRRRVFRDTEDKILGGVCSGIANYFDMDPLWLRLIWVAVTLLGGAGILIYIIMWIVIPPARTTAEKLEMRGEPVNINNIRKNIEEEMEHLKKKMRDFEKGAKDLGDSFKKKGRSREAADKFVDFSTSVFGSILRAVGKFLAFILIVVCTLLMIVFLGALFGFGDLNGVSLNEMGDMFFTNDNQADLALAGLMLFIGVPLLMMIYSGVRALFSVQGRNKIISVTSTAVWSLGLITLLIIGYQVGSDFSEQAKNKNEFALTPSGCDTFFLNVKKDDRLEEHFEGRSGRHFGNQDYGFIEEGDKKTFYGTPEFDIQESSDSAFHLTWITYARGENKKDALARAQKIDYSITQTDSLIEFAPIYEIEKNDKWRAQDVFVVLHVPRGKTIFFDKSMRSIIYDIENTTNTWDGDMLNRRWQMSEKGLACVDCDGLVDNRDEKDREK